LTHHIVNYTPFPYTTLFRSHRRAHQQRQHEVRITGRQVGDPQHEWRLAHLHAFEQYPIEGHEEGNLHEHGQATGGRIDLLLLVEDRKSTRLNSSHVKISYAV